MLTAQALHEWPTLLELAERRRMEPHILCVGVYFLFQHTNGLALTTPHLAHLLAEKACHGHAAEVEVNSNLVHTNDITLL